MRRGRSGRNSTTWPTCRAGRTSTCRNWTEQDGVMLKTILIALAAITVVFVGYVAMQPSEFHVVRTATVAAPTPEVFAQVNNFHNWQAWSPLGETRPCGQGDVRRAAGGTGRNLCLGRQRQDRRRADDTDGEPPQRPGEDQGGIREA